MRESALATALFFGTLRLASLADMELRLSQHAGYFFRLSRQQIRRGRDWHNNFFEFLGL